MPAPGRLRAWLDSLAVYRDRRVLAMLFIGFSSGLPFGALAEPLSAWLAGAGLDKTAIGLFALVSLPYSLKFLFAPFADRLALPLLGRRLGRRRGWALATQLALIATLFALGALPPDGFSIWQRDGRFWVALPEGWLERQQTLRIGWVDRYRR